jgi:hypothetical protein
MDQLVTDYVLGGSGTVTPPSSWTVALATTGAATYNKALSVWSPSVSGANVNEIGTSVAASYARQTINRDQTANGWTSSSNDATGSSTTGKQVTFGPFGTGLTPNGANTWVVTDGTTLNAGQLYFGADTASTRTFNIGDTEKVIPIMKVA